MQKCSAEELYAEIKCALDYFGLRFGQMDKMDVSFAEGSVSFHYNGRTATVNLETIKG